MALDQGAGDEEDRHPVGRSDGDLNADSHQQREREKERERERRVSVYEEAPGFRLGPRGFSPTREHDANIHDRMRRAHNTMIGSTTTALHRHAGMIRTPRLMLELGRRIH